MKIIIVGAGTVGSALAKSLVDEQHDVTVIDERADFLKTLSQQCDLKTIQGIGCYPETLIDAGAENCQMFIAVSSNDELNLLACQISYSLFKIPTKIARVKSEAYLDKRNLLFNKDAIQIDEIIAPEHLVSEQIAKLIEHPGAKNFFEFEDMHVSLVHVTAYYGGALVGNPLESVKNLLQYTSVNVVGIIRKGKPILISENSVIEAGDEVFFVVATNYVREVMSLLQRLENPYKRIMIYGGGTIGYSLAKSLYKKYSIKLIDNDRVNGVNTATKLENVLVFDKPSSLKELFESEQIEKVDLFLSVSNSDENNIIAAMLAKNMGAKKTATIIQCKEYLEVCENSIDITISPQLSTLSALLTFIRHADIKKVYSMRLGKSEAMEIVIHGKEKNSPIIGKIVKDIKLPQGTVICSLMRNNISYVDCDDMVIVDGDTILIFLANKSHIKELEKIVQPN